MLDKNLSQEVWGGAGLAFLFIPLLLMLEFESVGRVIGLEIFFLLLLVPAFLLSDRKLTLQAKNIFFLLLAWLCASMVSDFLNASTVTDASRGWARLVFIAINFFVLYKFLNSEIKWLLFFLGTFIAWIIRSYAESAEIQTVWKFGGGLFSAMAVVILIMLQKRERWRESLGTYMLVFIAWAILSFVMNCRSLAAGLLIAATWMFFLKNDIVAERISYYFRKGIVIPVVILALVLYVFGFFYVIAADSGSMGEEAQTKIHLQRLGGFDPVLGMLLGGRSEICASTAAIADKPLIGHGSWAKGWEYVYIHRAAMAYFKDDSPGEASADESDLIPTHSHIFGAWVDSGITGAVFWLFVLGALRKKLSVAVLLRSRSDLVFVSLVFWLVWDIFFSPFGALMRVWWAIIFVYLSRNGFENSKRVNE